jgi:hypothetical protein
MLVLLKDALTVMGMSPAAAGILGNNRCVVLSSVFIHHLKEMLQ